MTVDPDKIIGETYMFGAFWAAIDGFADNLSLRPTHTVRASVQVLPSRSHLREL